MDQEILTTKETDIWSFGCLLLQLLNGSNVFIPHSDYLLYDKELLKKVIPSKKENEIIDFGVFLNKDYSYYKNNCFLNSLKDFEKFLGTTLDKDFAKKNSLEQFLKIIMEDDNLSKIIGEDNIRKIFSEKNLKDITKAKLTEILAGDDIEDVFGDEFFKKIFKEKKFKEIFEETNLKTIFDEAFLRDHFFKTDEFKKNLEENNFKNIIQQKIFKKSFTTDELKPIYGDDLTKNFSFRSKRTWRFI